MHLRKYLGLVISGAAFSLAALGALLVYTGQREVGTVLIKFSFAVFVVGFCLHIFLMVNQEK